MTTGVISYGIYAWHPLILKYISESYKSFLFVLVLTWIVSEFSFSIFEDKIIKWNKKHE
jgi:peptidoglycan/LPS O-acetylase OafA/YrhL